MKLFDSELKVMEVLWEQSDDSAEEFTETKRSAKEIVDVLSARIGWNKNTTYTVIKKCIEKGAIERTEPGFLCKALVSRQNVWRFERAVLFLIPQKPGNFGGRSHKACKND